MPLRRPEEMDQTRPGSSCGATPIRVRPASCSQGIEEPKLPPQQQAAKAKRVRFLVFDVAARITSHARTLYAHVKGAVLELATLLEARRWLRARHRRRRLSPVPTG